MGLLDKLFGQSKKTAETNDFTQHESLAPCKTEQELIERYGGIAFDKQLDFGDIIGENRWSVDMAKGEISFGENLTFPIQVLGTFSHSSESWLWAWANTKSGLSEKVIQQSLQLKKYGEENGIDLLQNSEFDGNSNDLHLIGLIASGMFDSSAYYIADYGQGAMVVTIKDAKVDNTRKDNHNRILTVIPQLISQFEMNHQNAFINYLTSKGYAISQEPNKIIGVKNGNTIVGQFDELFRLTHING